MLIIGESYTITQGMDTQVIRDRVETIRTKREALLKLLEQPDLGTLRIDVNQALEEIDDLLEEFDSTFPAAG
jgi:hypothetical protein